MDINQYKLKIRWLKPFGILLGFTLVILYLFYANKHLGLTTYTITNDKIPSSFDGYRIIHLSDIHNDVFGYSNDELVKMVEQSDPDIITITGDLIDSYDTHIDIALDLIERLKMIAPIYYVSGNHEARLSDYASFEASLIQAGVTVLDDRTIPITRNDQTITLAGINDPNFKNNGDKTNDIACIHSSLDDLQLSNGYTILLTHHPEFIELYQQYPLDLILSGHAHGGQIRLPFIGGLLAPGQGWFPQYDDGLYTFDETTMIVSRGIGNSLFPLRINNDPQIILIELASTAI